MQPSLTSKLAAAWLALARPRNWLLFLLAYLALHMGMRLLLSDTLQLDDAEQLIQSQQLRLNYGNFQPPFYTWLLWGIWQFTAPSVLVLYLIRYTIIGLAFWLWHRVSLLLFDDPRWQVAAATSWLLIAQLGWKLHQGSTHTTLLTLALVMSLHAIVLILRQGRTRDYLYLGLAVGLGMMAKYSYAGFVVPMLLAGLAAPATRERLLRWPMLWSLLAATLVMLPALISLFAPDSPVGARLQGQTSYRLGGILAGDFSLLWQWLRGTAGFLAPLWLIYLMIFRVARQGAATSSQPAVAAAMPLSPHTGKGPEGEQDVSTTDAPPPLPPLAGGGWEGGRSARLLLDRFHLVVLVLVVVVSVFVGVEHLKTRWLHPFLMLVPFWWLLHARTRRRAWPVLQWTTVALLVLVVVARLWQMSATPYVGKKPSRVTWPVMAALRQLPPAVLQAPTLAADGTFLAAHLRLMTGRTVKVVPPESPPVSGMALVRPVPANGEGVDTGPDKGQGGKVVARRGQAVYAVEWSLPRQFGS